MGYAAALAAKLADTMSSEVGKAIGKTTILITNWKRVPRGTEGAISAEGCVAGICGAIFMPSAAALLGLISRRRKHVFMCTASAIVANVAESFIGAIWQSDNKADNSRNWLTNDVVNVLNTAIAAVLCILSFVYSGQ